MSTLTLNSDTFIIPSNWNELSFKALLKIGSLSLNNQSVYEFKLLLFFFITGLKVLRKKEITVDDETYFYLFHKSKPAFLISSHQLVEIIDSLDFLFEKTETKNSISFFLSSRLSKNIIGNIKHKKVILAGPADAITNLRTGEYIRCETCLYQYHKTQKEIHLDKLIATLWRPLAENPASDDIRIPFDDGKVESDAAFVSSLPANLKQAIFYFYSGSRRFLASKFTNAGSGTSAPSKDIFLQFMRLVNGLANNDVTKHEAIRQAYLVDTMVTIDEFARQQKEIEQKIKKAKR